MTLTFECNGCGTYLPPSQMVGAAGEVLESDWDDIEATIHFCKDCWTSLTEWLNFRLDIRKGANTGLSYNIEKGRIKKK